MNHIFCRKSSGTGNSGIADGDETDPVTLLLYDLTAFSYNGSCNASAVLEMSIGGIHYGVHLPARYIALYETQGFPIDRFFGSYVHLVLRRIHPARPQG
jgi:hypothetical protein